MCEVHTHVLLSIETGIDTDVEMGSHLNPELAIPISISEGLGLQAVAIPAPHSCESCGYKLVLMPAPLPVLTLEGSQLPRS